MVQNGLFIYELSAYLYICWILIIFAFKIFIMFLRYILTVFTTVLFSLCASAAVVVNGSQYKVIKEKPEAASGLNELIVIFNTDGARLSYTSSASQHVIWSRYSSLGGGYAEKIQDVTYDGYTSVVNASHDDMGYIIEDNGSFYYFWVVNYANHYMSAETLTVGPESDCLMAQLLYSGNADPIYYYGINGRQFELSRQIELAYNTLKWDTNTDNYRLESVFQIVSSVSGAIRVPSPLCNTVFSLTGDRFLKVWNRQVSVTSNELKATAVEANTSATQEQREVANEKKSEDGGGLGGSAPCDIVFKANVSDAAVFTEWQFSETPDFENISLRLNETEVNYTFREQGTSFVRFVCADASGGCEYYSDTYTVNIGESALDCPNAFSPGASEGVNDEWRVSYKSIISFECHIFNRVGVKMISLTDPSQGWDGKYNGKVVPAGVYFYVIKAMGADGKEYKLSGDINVINYK